jgi:uncharacterized membrane protein
LSRRAPSDFNGTLCSAIDDTIVEVLGHAVLDALYHVLKTQHGITRDELPYRTETIYHILENAFGVRGARTVGTRIAERFYRNLGLSFYSHEGYTLLDYVEEAKTKLAKM